MFGEMTKHDVSNNEFPGGIADDDYREFDHCDDDVDVAAFNVHLGQRENYDEFDHYDDDVESLGEYLLMTMLNLHQVNILDKEDRQVSLPINPDGRQVILQ